MIIRPIKDNILIKIDEDSETVGDAGLIIKPESAVDGYLATGEVIAQGPGVWAKKKDVRIPNGVEVGDGVVFVSYNKEIHTNQQFRSIHADDEIILKPKDIVAVFDRSDEGKIR